MKNMMKNGIAFLLICVLLAGCSASKTSEPVQTQSIDQGGSVMSQAANEGIAGNQDITEDQAYEENDVSEDGIIESGNGTASETTQETEKETKQETKEEKLVYTCDLTIETTTYKETMEEIEKQIKKYSGIIESQNEYDNDSGWYRSDYEKTSGTRSATIVVKIPSQNYQEFLKSLDGNGKMTNKSMDVTNITRTYYDTRATIESLQIQEKRLLKMMDEAKTIEDMITVEKRLTEVQTQLNQYKNQLSTMDTEVAYSTVTMNITEVMEYKAEVPGRKTNTFVQRLMNTIEDSWSGFLAFLEGLLFLIIRLLPFAVIIALLLFITKPLRRKLKEHRQRKSEEKGSRKTNGENHKSKKGKKGRFKFGNNNDSAYMQESDETESADIKSDPEDPEVNDPII